MKRRRPAPPAPLPLEAYPPDKRDEIAAHRRRDAMYDRIHTDVPTARDPGAELQGALDKLGARLRKNAT